MHGHPRVLRVRKQNHVALQPTPFPLPQPIWTPPTKTATTNTLHRTAPQCTPRGARPRSALPNPRDEDRKGCLVAESTRVHGGWIENSAWWLAARVRQCNENELQRLRHCGTWITWNDHTQDVRSWQHSVANEINRPTAPRLIFLWCEPAARQRTTTPRRPARDPTMTATHILIHICIHISIYMSICI
jgi:hypothetical protein